MKPSPTYIVLLDIKAVIRQWQDREMSDTAALQQIVKITKEANREMAP